MGGVVGVILTKCTMNAPSTADQQAGHCLRADQLQNAIGNALAQQQSAQNAAMADRCTGTEAALRSCQNDLAARTSEASSIRKFLQACEKGPKKPAPTATPQAGGQ
jgi:hypothetical protein